MQPFSPEEMLVCHQRILLFCPKMEYVHGAGMLYHHSKPRWEALEELLLVVEDICDKSQDEAARLAGALAAIEKEYGFED
jgi:hypothetical protein